MTKQLISIIAAMAHDRVIGVNNALPWDLPEDMAHFRQTTKNKPVVMGRKTFESIGKPLPGRKNVVISRKQDLKLPGCIVVHSLEDAIFECEDAPEIMIIGGVEIYRQALPSANKLYLTFIDLTVEGDAFFPEWEPSQWQEIARRSVPAAVQTPAFEIVEYLRVARG